MSVDADGTVVVGEPARSRLLTQPARTIYSVKRLMGRGVDDVQGELKIFPFRIDAGSQNVIRVRLGDRVFTPPEISAFILKRTQELGRALLPRKRGSRGHHRARRILTTRSGRRPKTRAVWQGLKSCDW